MGLETGERVVLEQFMKAAFAAGERGEDETLENTPIWEHRVAIWNSMLNAIEEETNTCKNNGETPNLEEAANYAMNRWFNKI